MFGSWLQKLRRYSGIGFLVAVGYMDPGNWATDIEAGSRFGYALFFVILLSSAVAMILQMLCVRLGVASQMNLAELCRLKCNPILNFILWLLAEVSIIACDFAEVLGTALALKLLFGLPLSYGVLLTVFDTLIILALHGGRLSKIKFLIIFLVLVIGSVFTVELFFSKPEWLAVANGFIPDFKIFKEDASWLLAIGIFGATVMPHNLYLHSAAVTKRKKLTEVTDKNRRIKLLTYDTLITLSLAFLINAAILILAAATFHHNGYLKVSKIDEAYNLLTPILGTSLASAIFAIALFAAGQSSTFTGTIAGQIILKGFLNLKTPRWKQRLVIRSLAVIPAWLAIVVLGEASIGKLLVLSQVVLSMQLPFAVTPLVIFCRDKTIMGQWRISKMFFIFAGLSPFA